MAKFQSTVPIAIALTLIFQSGFAQDRQVCITVDDLPGTNGSMVDYSYINNRLTNFFQENQIPAIGFVNEGKLYEDGEVLDERVNLLKFWLQKGLELGNHTYSHIFINQATIDDYKKDVLKGELISRPLLKTYNKKLEYFRHTQLRTGPTDAYRIELNQFLKNKSYKVAPVTIDNDEYIYAYCYARAKESADLNQMKKIGEDYLTYMNGVFSYYENLSVTYVGYEPPQILLIHANLLNADYIDQLVELIRKRNYQFVSLTEALKDPVYNLPTGTHQRGLSWLHRWMIFDGKEVSQQPEVSPFISDLFSNLR